MSAFRIENFKIVLLKAPQDLEKQKSSELVEAQGLGVRSASLLQAPPPLHPCATAISKLQSALVCKCAIAICAEEQKAAPVALWEPVACAQILSSFAAGALLL